MSAVQRWCVTDGWQYSGAVRVGGSAALAPHRWRRPDRARLRRCTACITFAVLTCCKRCGGWVCAHVPRAERAARRHSAARAGVERTAPHAPACHANGSMRLPLLPLIVLVLARPSAAGICWSGMERGGRCSSVVALRVGRAECCAGAARSPAAWSPQDLDSGEIFFFKALSGGVPCIACAESCADVTCGSGRRCVVRGGRARCVCAAACRRVGPVCGTDGKTYPSLCRLRRRACRRPAKHLALDYPGPCQEGSCDLVRCGGEKRCVLDAELGAHCVRCGGCNVAGPPVCAVDGKTYAGVCALRKAACERGRALPLAYRGSCIANATCANIRCGLGQRCMAGGASGARCVSCGSCGGGGGARRPLCGSDARTYPSWCRLQRAACHAGRVVDPLHPGPCKGKNTTDISVTRGRKEADLDPKRVL
ncbi:LOW QUALITY PROTEIN: follistatin-like [Achroia grisella]|uniref:LOW QUALITY PROTEIN: follistatin-like n=1 Tax=Achroia grisella TaxID=688607 RepID=UPI0027D1FAF2|nr:LOW QUALITY PROTEIN: follistatin-like [Achroia grisella]